MPSPVPARRLLAWSVPVVAALAIAVLGSAAPAWAHTALVSSTPAEGETVTELAEVSLTFTEQLLEIGNELVVVAPDGTETALEIGAVTETVTAPVPAAAIAPGRNALRYRVVSADGHPIEGTLTFTYAPPATTPSPSATAAATPEATPASSPAPSATATPASSPSSSPSAAVAATSGVPGWGWILGGFGVAAAAATAVILARGRGQE